MKTKYGDLLVGSPQNRMVRINQISNQCLTRIVSRSLNRIMCFVGCGVADDMDTKRTRTG
jgi:hypothetical protein